jgi:hypothetical protein
MFVCACAVMVPGVLNFIWKSNTVHTYIMVVFKVAYSIVPGGSKSQERRLQRTVYSTLLCNNTVIIIIYEVHIQYYVMLYNITTSTRVRVAWHGIILYCARRGRQGHSAGTVGPCQCLHSRQAPRPLSTTFLSFERWHWHGLC